MGTRKTPFLILIWGLFGSQFGLIWAPGGLPEAPMGPQRALWGRFFAHLFSMSFFNGFWVPPRAPTQGGAVPDHLNFCALASPGRGRGEGKKSKKKVGETLTRQ